MLRSLPRFASLVFFLLFALPYSATLNATATLRALGYNPGAVTTDSGWVSKPLASQKKAGLVKAFRASVTRLVSNLSVRDEYRERTANRQARFGFVLSLLGLLVIPVLPAIPGIILCIAALSEERKAPGTLTKNSRSLAEVGIVLGVLSIILLTLVLIIIAGLTHR